MGKHKKRSCKPASSNAIAKASSGKLVDAKCPPSVSKEEENNNDTELGKKMADCQLTSPSEPWEALKLKANAEFVASKFEEALNLYALAIEELENDCTVKDRDAKLAKLCGNRSICYHRMSTAMGVEKAAQQDLCLKALLEGGRAIHLDKTYDKGYFRCVSALLSLGRKTEVIEFLTKILNLYHLNGKDFRSDQYLMNLLVENKYSSATKTSSPNWERVKFKDNCLVLDPSGAGDIKTLNSELISKHKKLSVLVKPGMYCFGMVVVSADEELDVIGDIGPEGSSKEVEIYCDGTGSVFTAYHVFGVINGTLSIENLFINQKSSHPEKHGVFIFSHGHATIRRCEGYSKSSGWIAVSHSSYLEMSDSTIDGASGGVIVVEGSSATIDGCFVRNCHLIGVEARSGGTVVVTNSEISKCGSQGLAGHADAGCLVVDRCVFYANARRLQNEANISVARTIGVVRNSQITAIRGTCVMVQEGARLVLDGCLLAGGNASVGFSLHGSAMITKCRMVNCNLGVMVAMNDSGLVTMEDNEISSRVSDVGISSNDEPPVFRGTKRHAIKNLDEGRNFNSVAKKHLKRKKEQVDKDQFVSGMEWNDPRNAPMPGRICVPCGLSQPSVGSNFFVCSQCKIQWYCSKACQEKDLLIHGPICKKVQEIWEAEDKGSSQTE